MEPWQQHNFPQTNSPQSVRFVVICGALTVLFVGLIVGYLLLPSTQAGIREAMDEIKKEQEEIKKERRCGQQHQRV
jgi:hypothetical protein